LSPDPVTTPVFSAAEAFPPGTEVLSIDLPTALRLADADNPTIAVARQLTEAAYAAVAQADVLWLPNLQAGTLYLRHDGQIQNSTGLVFSTSKSALWVGGGALARVDTSEALFTPLVARRLAQAQSAAQRAVSHNVQLDVSLAYLDLLHAYGQLAVNADLLARDAEVVRRAETAVRQELYKTGADITRARTEYQLRVQERINLRGQVRVASSRLARLLVLQPTVGLQPADPTLLPVTLIAEDGPLDELVTWAIANRPEMAESRSLAGASAARLRQARLGPLMPHFEVGYSAGTFGGGQQSSMEDFAGRGDAALSAYWELHHFGLGNRAEVRQRRAQLGAASSHVIEVQTQVADEVVQAAQIARARREALGGAEAAVRDAVETFRRLDVIAFGMTGRHRELDSLEPLLAIQLLAQARYQYLAAIIDYNRAQFQLYTAVGQPSLEALRKACIVPVDSPLPPPFKPEVKKDKP
jgi:outer membrane protein TolC